MLEQIQADRARAQRNREMEEEEDRMYEERHEELQKRELCLNNESEKQKRNQENNENQHNFLLGRNLKMDPIEMAEREQRFLAEKKYQEELLQQVSGFSFSKFYSILFSEVFT